MKKMTERNSISVIPAEDDDTGLILTADVSAAGLRIDKYISEELSDYSRSYLQQLIDSGNILVNEHVIKSNYKIRTGDSIHIIIPEPEQLNIEPENIPLDIIYEDDHIIVVDKPKGMVVHPAAGHYQGTLVNALLYHCGASLSSINGILRPGIVHRIDQNTTGLLVACKSDIAHKSLSEQFHEHSITRVYTAIVYNNFTQNEGVIDASIGRSKKDRKKMAIDPNGRHAVTHYKVIKRLKNNFNLIECRLETGRTHQIRVHMASICHPLLGDDVYGPKNSPFRTEGQVLHAGTLGFIHPLSGEYVEFHSELPTYFQNIITKLS